MSAEHHYDSHRDDSPRRKIWLRSRRDWHAEACHRDPWVAQVTALEYAGMSREDKQRYDDAVREHEWRASRDADREYAQRVLDAFAAREFTLGDAHPDAREVLQQVVRKLSRKGPVSYADCTRPARG